MTPQPQPADDVVYRRFKPYVARVVRSVLGDHIDNEDIVHDVFVAVFAGRWAVRDAGQLRAWIRAVAVNTARTSLRRRTLRRSAEACVGAASFMGKQPFDGSPEDALALRESALKVVSMAPELRAVWWMRHVDELPLDEVAARWGCSSTTAKRRLRRAREGVLKPRGSSHQPCLLPVE